jgi:hypothetical protein
LIAVRFDEGRGYAPRRAGNNGIFPFGAHDRLPAFLRGAIALKLIFDSWNLQRIDNTDRSALEKRLGTTFPLIAGMGRDQASAS